MLAVGEGTKESHLDLGALRMECVLLCMRSVMPLASTMNIQDQIVTNMYESSLIILLLVLSPSLRN